ncbi:uncharacterized protein LOC132282229 [Cornus florida]|uniref:uncharacterized protein LOC132282229 n=1 Tax=Cornus florida TaxID=4283 RepID=UPI0028A213FA|nr:uncharacterized protein LOC132282229 [Cornus florida]
MSKKYTIEIHYDEKFNKDHYYYIGGKVDEFDNCDPDCMSYFEIEDMLTLLNLDPKSEVYYRDLSNGNPVFIVSDNAATESEDNNGHIEALWGQVEDLDGDSVYAPSDELWSVHSSSDEEVDSNIRVTKYVVKRDLGIKPLEIGMKFACADDFRVALRDHAIKHKYDFRLQKNEKNRITAVCISKCGWRIHASKNSSDNTFQIKTYRSTHHCIPPETNRQVTSRYIAKHYINQFRVDPTWKNCGLSGLIEKDFETQVSRFKVSRAKAKALEMIKGNFKEQFIKIREYCELVMQTSPGNVCKVKTEIDRVKKGGQLLSAVGRDPNDSYYPIIFAVVEVESKATWQWFINELMAIIGPPYQLTFISDRQKGLVDVLDRLCENTNHRFCARHMYENFRKKFPYLKLKTEFLNASNAFTLEVFKNYMTNIKKMNNNAFEWLNRIPHHLWSKCGFTVDSKCDLNSNNMCESWNRQILEDEVDKLRLDSRKCHVQPTGPQLYEVDSNGENDAVDMTNRKCNFRVWEVTGIPCIHVAAVINSRRGNIEDYVSHYYQRETHLNIYAHIVKPLCLRKILNIEGYPPILPPLREKPKMGRPTKQRIKSAEELRDIKAKKAASGKLNFQVRRGKCKMEGHNVRSCKNDVAPSKPPRSKGGRLLLKRTGLFVGESSSGGGARSVRAKGHATVQQEVTYVSQSETLGIDPTLATQESMDNGQWLN